MCIEKKVCRISKAPSEGFVEFALADKTIREKRVILEKLDGKTGRSIKMDKPGDKKLEHFRKVILDRSFVNLVQCQVCSRLLKLGKICTF